MYSRAEASETTLPSASDPMAGGTDSTQARVSRISVFNFATSFARAEARETPAAPADDPMTEATHDGMQARISRISVQFCNVVHSR